MIFLDPGQVYNLYMNSIPFLPRKFYDFLIISDVLKF